MYKSSSFALGQRFPEGRSLVSNIALVKQNQKMGAQLAVAFAEQVV
ncbi:MAG: hypothetical protein Q7T62_16150 [Undibacterium sp.]|nr:hypothetical protein [Undibacterium sp.]